MIAHAVPRPVTRMTVAGVALLVVVAGLAWWRTVSTAATTCCMLDGLAAAGRMMSFDARPAHFAGMWAVMMAAMMLPGIIPLVAAGRLAPRPAVAVASGYLAVWIPTAVIAFTVLAALNQVDRPSAGLDRIGGAIIALAGVYQFSGWKRRFAAAHRASPRSPTVGGAFGAGLWQGLWCVGSSWALMSVLLVVGVMNIAWMAAIGAVCLGEKTLAAHRVATAVGAALLVLGLVAVVYPPILPNYGLTQYF